jgi:DNA sulfur modification protein DndD
MILEHFRINNLFSYYGSCEFDLSLPQDDRNVVLIWGRNGYGKTSFLNSLKLLLSGVSDELRESPQIGRKLKRDQYLLGMGDEWMGIFNRHAKVNGETEFGLSLTWREAAGQVDVKRTWTLKNGKVHEMLRIIFTSVDDTDHPVELNDKDGDIQGEARAFLQARIPDAIMPFFIYDGEKVQQIAEENREIQMRQIEQLLDLAHIDVVVEYLDKNLTNWRRDSKDANQHTLNSLQFELQATKEKLTKLELDQASIEDEVEEITYDLRRTDAALQARRQFAMQNEENLLSVQHGQILARLEEQAFAFFNSFTRDAPLALHPALMNSAAGELEKIATHPNRRLKDEIGRIFSALPERLFSEPPMPMPPLSHDQDEFLRRKLTRVLDSYRPDEADLTIGLFHLSPDKAEAVLRVVEDYAKNDRQPTQWAQQTLEISKLRRDLNDIERKRNEVSNLEPSERETFRQRLAERTLLNEKQNELQRQLGMLDAQKTTLNTELGKKQDACRQEEKKLAGANQARGKLGLGQKIQTVLTTYRGLLKARRCKEIEDAINERFRELMTSHSLINRIRVNDDFSLHYFDASNLPVGMGNISAGMKQLVAQSLLWGLKDVSGKEAPVVVDTPLARIDRQHQENLITRYFPKAGSQVIVLPTDSEFDQEKYALLKHHVYREYRLVNPSGDNTYIEEGGYY